MPESPEVQVLAEFLAARLVGHEVASAELLDARVLKTRALPLERLIGQRISAVIRWGKHIDIDAGEHHLVISLGRHGWARFAESDADAERWTDDTASRVASIRFDDGLLLELTDAGEWRSLSLSVVPDATRVRAVSELGPDPADETFTRGDFERALGGRKKKLKALLQEQQALAGIGNAYSDEILHRARISPATRASDLDHETAERLFDAVREVIRGAISERRGIPIADLKAAKVAAMRVHGRTGETCGSCGDTIADVTPDGAAQYCPGCQTG